MKVDQTHGEEIQLLYLFTEIQLLYLFTVSLINLIHAGIRGGIVMAEEA